MTTDAHAHFSSVNATNITANNTVQASKIVINEDDEALIIGEDADALIYWDATGGDGIAGSLRIYPSTGVLWVGDDNGAGMNPTATKDKLYSSKIQTDSTKQTRAALFNAVLAFDGGTTVDHYGQNVFLTINENVLGGGTFTGNLVANRMQVRDKRAGTTAIEGKAAGGSGSLITQVGASSDFDYAIGLWAEPNSVTATNSTGYYASAHTGTVTNSYGIIHEKQTDGTTANMEEFFQDNGGSYYRSNLQNITSQETGELTISAPTQIYAYSELNLTGVASDGTGAVVCVKANGQLGTCTANEIYTSGTCTCT